MERLDRNLLDHAAAVGTREGGPEISEVYRLGALAERHCYLKTEHPFSPEEVEALLRFTDPLEAAQACWEENGHPYSFPICGLLEEINARGRFEMVTPPPPGHLDRRAVKIETLKRVLRQNLNDFQSGMMELDKEAIIRRSGEIAAMREAYSFMARDFPLTERSADILLEMDNPLLFAAEHWPGDLSELVPLSDHIWEAIEEAGADMVFPPEAPEKASVRDRIHKAAREAGQRPSPEGGSRAGETR